MNFNRNEFDLFKKEMKKAVADVEKTFEVEIKFGNISYSENDFKIQTQVCNGSVKEFREVEFSKICTSYGLTPSDFGKSFIHKNTTYTISGINTKKRKYSIITIDENGETVLFDKESVKRLLGKNN